MPDRQDVFNQYCENLLARYNRRNTAATTRHINSLCNVLRHEGCEVIQTMFGGSVRRRTYVNGLSDVDVLLMVNQSSLVSRPPAQVISHVEEILKRRFRNNRMDLTKLKPRWDVHLRGVGNWAVCCGGDLRPWIVGRSGSAS